MGTQFHIDPVGDDALRLEQAVLIYRSPRQRALATVHPIGRHRGKPVILAGAAMTLAATRQLAKELAGGGGGPVFLPPELLYAGADVAVWWAPPAVRHLWFRAPGLDAGERGARVPVPGTVFLAKGRACKVWVVKGRQRPTPATALWRAPFFNVAEDGAICWGNVGLPPAETPDRLADWTSAFFGSYFTHPNAAGDVVRHRDGAHGFWRAMLDGAYRRFPSSVLLPTGLTLGWMVGKEWGHD